MRCSGPLLLGCGKGIERAEDTTWETLAAHIDEDQVKLDVNRSFVYYPSGTPVPSSLRSKECKLKVTSSNYQTNPNTN